jgi:hypothetical protein
MPLIYTLCLGKINRKIEARIKGRHLVAKNLIFWPCYRVILITKEGKEDSNKVGTNERQVRVLFYYIMSVYRLQI